MDKSSLEAAVRVAFEDVPYPGDDNIGDPEGRDDAESVTEWLRGMEWRSLASEEQLGRYALYYMVPEASHYYLPAYLLGVLDNVWDAIGGIRLCFHPRNIEPERYPEATERFLTIVSLLSPSQKQVLRDVLIYGRQQQLDYFIVRRDEPQSLDPYDEPFEVTEEDIERSRAFWNGQIEETHKEIDPLIEYWSRI